MRLWLLLCSDLAIRSGTAARLTPDNYDPQTRTLTFTTKKSARQTLPVTKEIARILAGMEPGSGPMVRQLATTGEQNPDTLRAAFKAMRERLGITRKLTPHDLRRTTATRLYDATHDLRAVQALLGHAALNSTLWYLDHHTARVDVAQLELAKLNPETEVIQ